MVQRDLRRDFSRCGSDVRQCPKGGWEAPACASAALRRGLVAGGLHTRSSSSARIARPPSLIVLSSLGLPQLGMPQLSIARNQGRPEETTISVEMELSGTVSELKQLIAAHPEMGVPAEHQVRAGYTC